jgi:predicted tellurium resistance membrane protein TerC
MMLELAFDPQAWVALLTLTVLEVVLGIDNVIFISVLVSRLESGQAKRARQVGLSLALVFRVLLLFALTWLMALDEPVVEMAGQGFSWRDMILIAGGLFLIAKATHEIHLEMEGEGDEREPTPAGTGFSGIIAQVVVIDLVFSVDSIITAIGMAQDLPVMITAVILAVIVMYAASGPVSGFIMRHPTTKVLALAFLVLIGVALVADGFGFHIPRGYVYSAMGFAALVEVINVVAGRKRRARLADRRLAGHGPDAGGR